MAREVLTFVWCDLCKSRDTKEPSTSTESVTLSALSNKALTLDLCDACKKELMAPLIETLRDFGAALQSPSSGGGHSGPARTGPHFCKVVGCSSGGTRPFATAASFGSHLRTVHELRVPEYRERYEDGPPAATQPPRGQRPGPEGSSEDYECPDCDKVYAHRLGNNKPAQALGMHRAKLHGWSSPNRA